MHTQARHSQARHSESAWRACALPLVLVAVLLPALAHAAPSAVERSQTCERRGITRVLELREEPGRGLPCEVVYLKPDEDRSARVMWTARTDRGFCTTRFESFLVKLETKLDWSCEPSDETPVLEERARSVEPAATSPAVASSPDPADPPVVPSAATVPTAQVLATSEPASVPALARAAPLANASADAGDASDRLAELRALVPSGPYAPVPVPRPGQADDGRIAPFCPPGGPLFWNVRDRQRPVLELGSGTELAVRLPDTALGEGFVLEADPSVATEPGAARELQSLSLAPTASGRAGRAIDIRVAPRGPGGGALSPSVCRYTLGGN